MEVARILYWISFVLVIVGAINWALVGLNPIYNLVEMAVTKQHSRWVYYLVGLAAVYLVIVKIYKMTRRQKKVKDTYAYNLKA